MDPGDILYSNVCTSPLFVMVRRGDGQYWDFVARAYATPAKPIDKARFCLALTRDPFLTTSQRCMIPAKAAEDPQAELIEAVIPSGGFPQPTQSFWIGSVGGGEGEGGVPMNLARGATIRFTA